MPDADWRKVIKRRISNQPSTSLQSLRSAVISPSPRPRLLGLCRGSILLGERVLAIGMNNYDFGLVSGLFQSIVLIHQIYKLISRS